MSNQVTSDKNIQSQIELNLGTTDELPTFGLEPRSPPTA